MFYKLDKDKNVVPSSLEEWATFIENELPSNYRQVGRDIVNGKVISTIFIGLCHNYIPHSGIPIVFETMIFDESQHAIYQKRYSTWKEAEEGHEEAIEWIKKDCNKNE